MTSKMPTDEIATFEKYQLNAIRRSLSSLSMALIIWYVCKIGELAERKNSSTPSGVFVGIRLTSFSAQ